MRLIDADALIEFCAERWIPLNIDAVNMQPTIQPQSTTGQLNDGAQSTNLIDRQAAIDGKIIIQRTNGVEIYYDEAVPVGYLKRLPTVQPEPSTNCSEFPNNSDTVSRQAAIDSIAKQMPRPYTPDGSHPGDEEIFRAQEIYVDCIESIEILPAVQPEVIRCKDCKYNVSSHKCLHPESFFLVPDDDFYCGYAKRRTDGQE